MSRNPFDKYLTPELREHKRLVEWLRFWPLTKNTRYFHTMNEGKKSPFERYLFSIMGSTKDVPDFIFPCKRKGFVALAIELKATGTVVFNKNGTPRKDVEGQWQFMEDLKAEGWSADFAVGYEDAMTKVKNYFE